jgi:hypothetical protein
MGEQDEGENLTEKPKFESWSKENRREQKRKERRKKPSEEKRREDLGIEVSNPEDEECVNCDARQRRECDILGVYAFKKKYGMLPTKQYLNIFASNPEAIKDAETDFDEGYRKNVIKIPDAKDPDCQEYLDAKRKWVEDAIDDLVEDFLKHCYPELKNSLKDKND